MKYITIIVNQYLSENLGDKLLNKTIVDLFKKERESTITLGFAQTYNQEISYDCEYIAKRDSIDIIKRNSPEALKYWIKYRNKLINQIQELDISEIKALVIGGGQLLKHKSVFMYCMQFWAEWAKKNNVPMYVYGVGIDDDLSNKEVETYKSILRSAKYVSCRDQLSCKIVNNIMGIECDVFPDVAFSATPKISHEKEYSILMPYCYKTAVKSFGYCKTKEEFYKELLEISLRESKPIHLACTTESDYIECNSFIKWAEMKGMHYTVLELKTIDDFLEVLGKAHTVISGRMHALIVGKISGANVIPIVISSKIQQFALEYCNDVADIIDITHRSKQGVMNLIKVINDV